MSKGNKVWGTFDASTKPPLKSHFVIIIIRDSTAPDWAGVSKL